MRCPYCKRRIPRSLSAQDLGKVKSEAKAAAARANGRKGGRPKKEKES